MCLLFHAVTTYHVKSSLLREKKKKIVIVSEPANSVFFPILSNKKIPKKTDVLSYYYFLVWYWKILFYHEVSVIRFCKSSHYLGSSAKNRTGDKFPKKKHK
jgi:hypothetical protein